MQPCCILFAPQPSNILLPLAGNTLYAISLVAGHLMYFLPDRNNSSETLWLQIPCCVRAWYATLLSIWKYIYSYLLILITKWDKMLWYWLLKLSVSLIAEALSLRMHWYVIKKILFILWMSQWLSATKQQAISWSSSEPELKHQPLECGKSVFFLKILIDQMCQKLLRVNLDICFTGSWEYLLI